MLRWIGVFPSLLAASQNRPGGLALASVEFARGMRLRIWMLSVLAAKAALASP